MYGQKTFIRCFALSLAKLISEIIECSVDWRQRLAVAFVAGITTHIWQV